MGKYLKRLSIALAVVIFVSGAAYLTIKFLYPHSVNKALKATETSKKILDENKDKLAAVEPETLSGLSIYNKMHKMANTLIIAEDKQVWGTLEINDESILETMAEVNNCADLDNSGKETLLNILYSWQKGDYSQGVAQHNYLWKQLDGNVGKAKELRPEYRK